MGKTGRNQDHCVWVTQEDQRQKRQHGFGVWGLTREVAGQMIQELSSQTECGFLL